MVSQQTMSEYLQKIRNLHEDICLLDGSGTAPDFQLTPFWKDIAAITQKISFASTKFCLSFSKPPRPTEEEACSELNAMVTLLTNLKEFIKQLPKSCGEELHREVIGASLSTVLASAKLVTNALEEDSAALERTYRQITGQSWEACMNLLLLPRTNTYAIIQFLESQKAMVDDAFSEISEAMQGDGTLGEDDSMEGLECWTDQDKEKLKSAVNIVKAISLLHKRALEALRHTCSHPDHTRVTEQNIALWAHVDKVRTAMADLSENTDDVVLACYPSVDYANLAQVCHQTVNMCKDSMTSLRQGGIGSEDTPQQLTFIDTALTHNLALLDNSIAAV